MYRKHAAPPRCVQLLIGGAACFLYMGLSRLPNHRHSTSHFAAVLVFGFATVAQLTLSGVYHLLDMPSAARPVLQLMDHAAIFVLIAATLTAIHGILFTGRWRRWMIIIAWSMCTIGITLKMMFFTETAEGLGLACYFGMGLLGLASTVELGRRYGASFALPWLTGGLIYTAGALLDFLRLPWLIPGVFGPHEFLHIAVLAALAVHWSFVLRVLDQHAAKAITIKT